MTKISLISWAWKCFDRQRISEVNAPHYLDYPVIQGQEAAYSRSGTYLAAQHRPLLKSGFSVDLQFEDYTRRRVV